MDSEVLYSTFGIVSLIVIGYLVLKGKSEEQHKTKAQKRTEIINEYKQSLIESLEGLDDNKEERMKRKSVLLKKYSDELSQNIFFDQDEIKELILELSSY